MATGMFYAQRVPTHLCAPIVRNKQKKKVQHCVMIRFCDSRRCIFCFARFGSTTKWDERAFFFGTTCGVALLFGACPNNQG
jgi:hypothetical protein